MSLAKQELITLPENLSSPPVFSEVRVTRSLGLWVVVCPFLIYILCIVRGSRGRDRM